MNGDALIGEGYLGWKASERISDRYGIVHLYDASGEREHSIVAPDGERACITNLRGYLVAEVLEVREHTHIGDIIRGIYPAKPEAGERVVLNDSSGRLVFNDRGVGIFPEDGRSADWLIPHRLYRVHWQRVRLWFYPITPGRRECGHCDGTGMLPLVNGDPVPGSSLCKACEGHGTIPLRPPQP